jgi:hypothetical protein
VPVPAARWQSFGSPPEAPELLVLSVGLPASAPVPVELPPLLSLPDAAPPDDELLPEIPPLAAPEFPELPELPDDWAMADVASVSASADVARIFMIMSITFGLGHRYYGPTSKTRPGSCERARVPDMSVNVQRKARSGFYRRVVIGSH